MTTKIAMSPRQKSPWHRKMVVTLAVSAALILPFWLYTQPDLLIMLAEQLWACF